MIWVRILTGTSIGVLTGVGLLVTLGGGIRSLALIVLAFTTLMMGVCMLACIVPAQRALRIEPTEALKAEA